ncbi:hypothetical protein [Flavobacterium sp.]
MKNFAYYIIVSVFFITTKSAAQVTVVKYGPPAWAPSAPVTVQYYYLPDIEVYYDAADRRYIYMENDHWVRTTELPAYYKGYDLYQAKPIYLTNYKGKTPYVLYREHKVKHKGNGWKNGHRAKK